VHCETGSGILNPIQDIGNLVKQTCSARRFIIDAMSTFGGYPINLIDCEADFLLATPNKCLQGVPGFGFVIAEKSSIEASEGHSRTLSLDLYEQWKRLNSSGKFRFTPPTHVLLAFQKALLELEEETLVGRINRYKQNAEHLLSGMRKLGFKIR